ETSDLGQTKQIEENKGEIVGVLPYVDPALLKGGKLTEMSDVYG
ncbi:18710_t:CDS:1, partial [Dentiscutata erythropus]